MKSAALTTAVFDRPRWLDFVEMTKPRIAVLVLFTVGVGALLARQGFPDWIIVLHTLIGTGLVAAGASALNQLLERHTDALMHRTENRPLPAGRLQAWEVLLFGVGLGGFGLFYLAWTVKQPLAVGIAGITFLSYVLIYTPLKRHTTLNTLIGAIPGALPPVIGWTALTGSLNAEVVTLFLLLFLWQVPHFLAIAWLYREDYGRAGLKMLPTIDAAGDATARQMLIYCVALVGLSLSPILWQRAGWFYATGAVLLGYYFLESVWSFGRERNDREAKRVLHASLLYLPALLGLLLLETLVGAPSWLTP